MTQTCTRCIYDSTIPYITFDQQGVCCYCNQTDTLEREYPTGQTGRAKLEELAGKIRSDGKNKPYDVVIGVSGGCDSSYMLHLAKELGLRPLAAHFDNTWNSKTAVENIHTMLEKLDIDLFTHVVHNQEYNDIFKSFLLAGVPDIDTPADIGLATTHYLAARKYGIKYIFEGHSFRTEGISPHGWFYMDAKYISTVHRQFGKMKMKTYPNLWIIPWLKWSIVNGIKKIRPLYWLDYDKAATKKMLTEKYGWAWYGGHHMENKTSYFTNNYYLPKKFGIDLRLCEYSALVRSGQISREQALEELGKPKTFDPALLEELKKRLNLTDGEFNAIMEQPNKSYRDYKTYKQTFERMRPLFWAMYKLDLVPKSFYLKFTRKYED